MANNNISAHFQIQGGFVYQRDVTGNSKPVVASSLFNTPARKTFATTGSGAGVATKAFETTQTIVAGGTYSLDLGSLTDQHGDSQTWTKLKVVALYHSSSSAASSVEITGAATNAQTGLRASKLLPGDYCVPLFAPTSVGMNITGSDDKIIVANNDGSNAATITLFLEGE